MADKKFNIIFDVNANINPMKTAVSSLNDVLRNLKIPDSFKKSIQSTVDALEKEITNFESFSGKTFENMGDFNKANKSFEKISDLFSKLGIQVKNLKGIDPNKFLPSEILKKVQTLQQSWTKLKQVVEKGNNAADIEATNKALEKQKSIIDSLETKKRTLEAQNRSRNATIGAKTKEIDSANERINGDSTKGAIGLRDQLKALEDAKVSKSSVEYKTLNAELERNLRIVKNATTEIQKLKSANADNNATINGIVSTLKDTSRIITDLENKLNQLQNTSNKTPEGIKDFIQELKSLDGIDTNEIDQAGEDLEELQKILNNYQVNKIEELKNSLNNIDAPLEDAGKAAQDTGNKVHEYGDECSYAQEKTKDLEHVANQVKQFFSIGNTVQLFKRAIRSAFETIKELDAVMTQTAVVTDFSVGDMWAQLPEYTKRANELGVSVKGAYEAATLYYQQGLNTNQVIGVSNETLKMAKIAAIDYATATDYMTSALRGFNMEVNEASARQVNDIYSQLAAKTAADTEEISIAMSKTAPLAHNAGMEIQTTAAFLAQAIETTREAPETIGTALKTVIARFQELKKDPALIEPVEGEIVDANKIEGALRTIGVALRDTSGQFRDLDDVFLEISQKWNSLDTNTQRYIATIAAGSRQQSRFIAMMANYDRTMELVEMANTSAGASQQQFEKTLDSMQSKLDRLKNAWNEFTMGLANNSVIKAVVDLLTDLLNTINKISSDVSGNNGILKSLVDIGILMGGLKLGKAAFSGFFGWLQGKGKVEGRKTGENLSKGLLGSFLSKDSGLESSLSKFRGKIYSINKILNERKIGYLTNKETFTQLFPVIDKLKTSFSNLKKNGVEAGEGIGKIFKAIPPQAYAIALGVAAATAGIILLIKTIKANSIEGRIKAAEEQTKLAQTAAENAKEAYDNLLEGKSKYSELQTTLDNLTYGTKAWKEALIEANGQVLQLLQTYPQLADYIRTGTGGRLEFADEGWDEVIAQQEDAIRRTTNNLLGSQIYRANLENEKLFKDLQKTSGIQRRGLLEELIKEYEQNPRFFTKDKEGQYNEDLQSLAKVYGVNPEKIYEAQNAIREYEAAIQQNGATIESYVDSLISNNGKLEGLDPKIAETIQEAYNKIFSGDYNKYIDRESQKLFSNSRDGREASLGYINSLLEGYELETENTLHNGLQALYKHLANITGEEIEDGILQSDEAMAQAIARMRFGDTLQTGMQEIAKILEKDTSGNIQKVLDILAGNFEKFSSDELEKLGNLTITDIKDFAKAMGLSEDEFKKVLESLGYTFDDFKDEFSESVEVMTEQIRQSKIDLVQAMLDTGTFTDSRVLLSNLDGLTDQQVSSLSSIASQISGLTKETQSSLLTNLPGYFKTGNQASIEELFGKLDFSDPISALIELNEAANNSSETIQEIAVGLLETEQELFSAGNLFKDFIQSASYEDLNDEIKEFAKNQGKITPANINELAKSNDKLNKLLKTGTINATGLARALTAFETAGIPMEHFTTRVLNALSATNSLDDRLGDLQEHLANFDPGIDESVTLDTYSGFIEKMQSYTEKNQYGNTAFQGYLKSIFGEEAIAKILASGNGQQIAAAFDQKIAQAQNWLSGDGYGFWADLANNANQSLVTFTEESDIFIDVAEKTTEQLIADLMQLTGATEDFVTAQLGGFLAHSFDLRQQLADNDFQKEITELLIPNGNDMAVISQQELEAYAIATNRNIDDITDEIKSQAQAAKIDLKIVDWINPETGIGYIGKELIEQIENQFKQEGQNFNLFKDLDLTWKSDENNNALIDIEQLTQKLEELGLTAEQINSVFKDDAFTNWIDNAQSTVAERLGDSSSVLLSKTIEVPVRAVDEKTGEKYITVEEVVIKSDTVEGVESGVNAAMEAANYNLIAEGIVEQDFSQLGEDIEKIIGDAAKNAARDLTSKINNIHFSAKSVQVNVQYKEINKPKALDSDLSSGNAQAQIIWSGSSQTRGEIKRHAEGSFGLPHTETALTGEEGYELAYDSHGAFLLGVNGPEITKLEKGTVIYPHDKSKKILKGFSQTTFPNYKSGTISNYATGFYNTQQKLETNINTNTNIQSVVSSVGKVADAAKTITEETEKWENSIDWLYNLTQKINTQFRIREKLEHRYQTLLKTHRATGLSLKQLIDEQIKALENRQKLEEKSIELRKKELYQYLNSNKAMMKYAVVQWDTLDIRVAWDSINKVTDKDQGEKIEKYISQLEKIIDEIKNSEDSLEDIEDSLIELKERGKNQYRDLENRVLDALISREQELIDKQEEINDSINKANSSLIDAIQKNVEKMRQDRENQEKKDSISEKERRLAYLQQDTTGSNALEIKKLQEEIAKERQDFSDTLVDQAINDLKEQNDLAAEQREQQISLLQSQLEEQEKTGYWIDEATRIVREGLKENKIDTDSELYKILQEQEDYVSKSYAEREYWNEELANSISEAFVWLKEVLEPREQIKQQMIDNSKKWWTASEEERKIIEQEQKRLAERYTALTGEELISQNGDWYTSDGELFYNTDEFKDEVADLILKEMQSNSAEWKIANEDRKNELADRNKYLAKQYEAIQGTTLVNNDGSWYASGSDEALYSVSNQDVVKAIIDEMKRNSAKWVISDKKTKESLSNRNKELAELLESYGGPKVENVNGTWRTSDDQALYTTTNDDVISAIVDIMKANSLEWYSANDQRKEEIKKENEDWAKKIEDILGVLLEKRDGVWYFKNTNEKLYSKYKEGGLADFTGPAWLDGTKTKPEMVLNARDTQNFIELKDILASLRSGLPKNSNLGDWYLDIDINVAEISNDYDVDQMVTRVKQSIYEETSYRNVNTINFLK